jgi:hypothetical protein
VVDVLGVVLVEELGLVVLADPEELGIVLLLLVLGDVLEVELGDVLLADDVLGDVEAVALVVDPVALAVVLGTMPGGQLFAGDELLGVVVLGVVEVLGVVVDVPVCDEGVVELVPVCDDDGEVVVVELVVVDVLCAATHVAHAVRINTNVNFFMFSVLVKSSGSRLRCPFFRAGALP